MITEHYDGVELHMAHEAVKMPQLAQETFQFQL